MQANSSIPQKSLRQLAEEIAKALGSNWHRSTKYDADDASDVNPWRMRLENTGTDEALFLSTTWSKVKGQLHISGWYPERIDHYTAQRIGQAPSINVNPSKPAEQIARDIERRLLPEFRENLAEVLTAHAADVAFNKGKETLKEQVAKLIGATVKPDSDTLYGSGCLDVQISSPDSIRITGHCLYLNLDQLRRIRTAVPELFEREGR